MKKFSAIVLMCSLVGMPLSAAAQAAYPSKPITLTIPFPPGGASDATGRKVGLMLSSELGQPVIIDNRPGAGGNMALDHVAGGAADGYSILQGNTSVIALNPNTYKTLRTSPVKDLALLKMATEGSMVLAVNPSLPVRTLKELIDYSRANPGKINYASAGSGGITHVGMELLKSKTGLDASHVPYKGGASAMPDLLSGRVHAMLDLYSQLGPFINQGKLRAIVVTNEERSPFSPDVPTLKEAGYPGLAFTTWTGFFVPARTPANVQATLRSALDKIVESKEFDAYLAQVQNSKAPRMTTEQMNGFIKQENDRWGEITRAAKITAD
ncbi:MAG: tripartite tricarboxylate transporter substrate binding protein [Pseudomonadota bacterium]